MIDSSGCPFVRAGEDSRKASARIIEGLAVQLKPVCNQKPGSNKKTLQISDIDYKIFNLNL